VYQNLIEEHQTNLSAKQELIQHNDHLKLKLDGHTNERESLQIQNEELNS